MINERFKELFGENEPIKEFAGHFDFDSTEDFRIFPEELYLKMLVEIESKPRAINEESAKSIIDLVVENEDLKQSIADLYLYIQEAKKGNKHVAIQCDNELMRSIFTEMENNFENIRDKFKLTKKTNWNELI